MICLKVGAYFSADNYSVCLAGGCSHIQKRANLKKWKVWEKEKREKKKIKKIKQNDYNVVCKWVKPDEFLG